MRRARWRVGGLYGRLIASYILVTLLAALVIEVAVAVGPIFASAYNPDNTEPLGQVLAARYAPHIADAIAKHPQDYSADLSRNLNALLNVVNVRTNGTHAAVAMLDTQGQLVAISAAIFNGDKGHQIVEGTTSRAAAGSYFTTPSAQTVIRAALAGDDDPVGLLIIGTDGFTTGATAIRQPGAGVLGVLAVSFDGKLHQVSPPTDAPAYFIGQFFSRLQPAALYFVLLASGIGTLTGGLISRNLTRRLGRITVVAEAWSRGDLGVTIPDPARDELGQLAGDLNRMAEQIQTLLTTRQELAVVEERNRLARDLHDSVKQHVFANALLINAARHRLAQAQIDQASTHLVEAEALAQQAQDELTALIGALRPAALADKGLADVLRGYAEEWSARMGIAAQVRVSGTRATPLAIEEALFRVTQEALTNVARHSAAQTVALDLLWEPAMITLTIVDDGVGFDARSAGKGVGLSSMRERVTALGGTCTIMGTATGTMVQVSIPLTESTSEVQE